MLNNMSYETAENVSPLASRSTDAKGVEFATAVLINVVAFFGNMLVCIAIWRNSRLRSVTGFFILSLALSDVLMATLCMPLSVAASLEGKWIFGLRACQMQGYLINILAAISLHTMALTAIHRYFCVVRPNKCRKLFTKKRTILMISCLWVVVLIVPTVEIASGVLYFVFHEGMVMCIIEKSVRTKWLANLSAFIIVNIILPMVVMFICYFKVFKRVRQHKVDIASSLHTRCNTNTFNKGRLSLTTTLSQQGKSLSQNQQRKKLSTASSTWTNHNNGKQIIVQEIATKSENYPEKQEELPALEIKTLEINYEQQRSIKTAKYEAECDKNSARSSISDWLPSPLPLDHAEMFAQLSEHRCSIVSHRSQSLCTSMPSRPAAYTSGMSSRLIQQRNSIAVVTQRRASLVLWLNQQRDLLSTTLNKNRVEEAAGKLQLKAKVEDIKITSVLFVVVLGFMLCWFPILVISFYIVASENDYLPRGIQLLYTYLGATSSAINPCIYGLMNRYFRSEYLKIILCKRKTK